MSIDSVGILSRSDLYNRHVFVRVDFNCPIEYVAGKPLPCFNDARIRSCLPTLAFLRSNGAKIILCSHLGRPNGKYVEKYSMKPIAEHLRSLMDVNVVLAPDCVSEETHQLAWHLDPGDILMLENVRFYPEEESNNDLFAGSLASLSDGIYVNEAFATSHREHSSILAITAHVSTKVAGYLLKREVDNLNSIIRTPRRPLVVLLGGAKLTSKIPILFNLIKTCDKLIIGGGICFTFMKSQGYTIGFSLYESSCLDTARDILREAKTRNVTMVFPVDFLVSEGAFSHGRHTMVVEADDIPFGWAGVDLGPRSIRLFENELTDCNTIFWNGPMGVYEEPRFSAGTQAMAEFISAATSDHVRTVISGADTVRAAQDFGCDSFTHISTGGQASLEMLEGKTLPGIKALEIG